MLILGDQSHHHGRVPWVTGFLVVANLLVYCLQLGLGEPFTNGFSLVPKEITEFRDITQKQRVKVTVVDEDRYGRLSKHDEHFYINHYPGPFPIALTLFTSMFLHADMFHLIGNMWFLLVFGRNVECALNHGRFIAFYVLCGIVGGLSHVATDPHSVIPCLGASGAISGVMGAYVAIHPLNKIRCWCGWWFGVIEVPALVIIGMWFLLQYLSAFTLLEHPEFADGVAYWDHLGGFLTGVVFIWATVFFLKYEQARAAVTAGEAPGAVAAVPEVPALAAMPDLFASIPETGIRAGAPAPSAPSAVRSAAYDPFTSCLPK
jgi:membrane associated rhomboid family serine protease